MWPGVTAKLALLPRQMFVAVGNMVQTGFGFTTTIAVHDPIHPLASRINAVKVFVPIVVGDTVNVAVPEVTLVATGPATLLNTTM